MDYAMMEAAGEFGKLFPEIYEDLWATSGAGRRRLVNAAVICYSDH